MTHWMTARSRAESSAALSAINQCPGDAVSGCALWAVAAVRSDAQNHGDARLLPSLSTDWIDGPELAVVDYVSTTEGISTSMLDGGFFVGWPNPPDAETHLQILDAAYRIWLAIDSDTGNVVGFINAVSDGVLTAYMPLLEVLPSHQGHGIGRDVVRRMLDSLQHLYMVDLLCDPDLQSFYEHLGMTRSTGMVVRHYTAQSGVDG